MTKQQIAALQAEARRVLDAEDEVALKRTAWKAGEAEYYMELRTPAYPRYGEDAVAVPRATRTHRTE